MTLKSNSVNLNLLKSNSNNSEERQINLNSDYKLSIKTKSKKEIIELLDNKGNISLEIKLTDSGPVISAQGLKLDISSTEDLSFRSKKIIIDSEEETLISSQGKTLIKSKGDIKINSDNDIRMNSKLIYLN